jgi:DNA-binding MarR family transcriptional regulator
VSENPLPAADGSQLDSGTGAFSATSFRSASLIAVLPSPKLVRVHTVVIQVFADPGTRLMETRDRLPLELRAAYLALHRCSDMQFAKLGVTADQFVLLATLARGHALTQRELAARMPSDPSTVRAMLVLLEKRGLVSRSTHPTDGRAKTVALTESGLRKFRRVFKAGQAIRDQMVSSLSAEESRLLVTLLRRVSNSLADATMVTAAASTANGN